MDQAWYSQVSGICGGGSARVLAHPGRRHSAPAGQHGTVRTERHRVHRARMTTEDGRASIGHGYRELPHLQPRQPRQEHHLTSICSD
jgi:hypothetical protein